MNKPKNSKASVQGHRTGPTSVEADALMRMGTCWDLASAERVLADASNRIHDDESADAFKRQRAAVQQRWPDADALDDRIIESILRGIREREVVPSDAELDILGALSTGERMSRRTLAKASGWSEVTVRERLPSMMQRRWVEHVGERGGYRITTPGLAVYRHHRG